MRIFISLLALMICLDLTGWAGGGLAAGAESPEALPGLLQQAVDSKDGEAALARLDLERVITRIFSETLPQINESVQRGEIILNPPLAAALGSLNSGNAMMQRTATVFLTAEIGKLIVYGVESGSFAGTPLPEDERRLLDGGVFSQFGDISLARKEFSGTRLIGREGDSAVIWTELFDYGVGRAYPLVLGLELTDGLWKVVSIDNAAELYKELLGQS